MKFTAIVLASALFLGLTNAEENPPCISGSGEFPFRDTVAAHFSLNACIHDEKTGLASGDLYTGQFNAENDEFHYQIDCMTVDKNNGAVYLGAEMQRISEYHKTIQDPEAFQQALIEGDPEYIREYEKRVHYHQLDNNAEYLPALLDYLEEEGLSLQDYETNLEGGENGSGKRNLKGKSSADDEDEEIVSLVTECAKSLVLDYACSPPGPPGSLNLLEPSSKSGSKKSSSKKSSEDTHSTSAPFSTTTGISLLEQVCYVNAIFMCAYLPLELTGSGSGRRLEDVWGGEAFVAANGQVDSHESGRGTLALFRLTTDAADHAIAVKLNHDFDTSCADFGSTIDQEFFTADTVDKLTKGTIRME